MEMVWKIYAFGVVKCWATLPWVLKAEWAIQPLMLTSFVLFLINYRKQGAEH